MQVNLKKEKMRKFIGSMPENEMRLVEKAMEIDKRESRISFIRKATNEYAKKVLARGDDHGATTTEQ